MIKQIQNGIPNFSHFFSYDEKSAFWTKNSDIVETVLLEFSFYVQLTGIINERIQLKKKHDNNSTIWVSLWKVCSSLCNLLPGAGSEKGQVNLPMGLFKHFSKTGSVPKIITSWKVPAGANLFQSQLTTKDNFLRGMKRVLIKLRKKSVNKSMILIVSLGMVATVLGVTSSLTTSELPTNSRQKLCCETQSHTAAALLWCELHTTSVSYPCTQLP